MKSIDQIVDEPKAELYKKNEKIIFNTSREIKIKNLQRAIFLLGYRNKNGDPIKVDGVMGEETKKAITALFAIDCTGLNSDQILALIGHNSAKENIPANPVYFDYSIANNNGNPTTQQKNLNVHELSSELSKMTCSVEQICFESKSNESTVQFSCNSEGNKATVSISTNGKLSLGLSRLMMMLQNSLLTKMEK